MKKANVTIRIQSAVQHALSVHPVTDPGLRNKLEFALLTMLEAADAQSNPGTPASWVRRVVDANTQAALDSDPELRELFNEAGPTAVKAYNAGTSRKSAPMSASARMQRLAGILQGEASSSEDEE